MTLRTRGHDRVSGTWCLTRGRTAVLTVLAVAGLTLGACGSRSAVGSRGAEHASLTAASSATTTTKPPTTTSTTSTTLPSCGATRDPFDPTNAPPPAGSLAVC